MGESLRVRRRCRPVRRPTWPTPGRQKALNQRQEAMIRRLIVDPCPDQLKLPFGLWSREAVGQLIVQRTGIQLSLTAIGRYLAAWHFTAQKPIRRARQRN